MPKETPKEELEFVLRGDKKTNYKIKNGGGEDFFVRFELSIFHTKNKTKTPKRLIYNRVWGLLGIISIIH